MQCELGGTELGNIEKPQQQSQNAYYDSFAPSCVRVNASMLACGRACTHAHAPAYVCASA